MQRKQYPEIGKGVTKRERFTPFLATNVHAAGAEAGRT